MSGIEHDLALHDMEIWGGTEQEGEPDDILSAAMQSLQALSGEFKGLADRLDQHGAATAALSNDLQKIQTTMSAVLSAQLATIQAIERMTQTATAPRRIVKDKDGKPVGVEIVS